MQNSAGIADVVEAGDGFGSALTTGDFNGDGRDDLSIGVPAEDVGAMADAGAVHVIYGSAGGLASAGSQLWNQNSAGVADVSESADRFGSALAAGKLNNDAFSELVVGVADESVGAIGGCRCRACPAGRGGRRDGCGVAAVGAELGRDRRCRGGG